MALLAAWDLSASSSTVTFDNQLQKVNFKHSRKPLHKINLMSIKYNSYNYKNSFHFTWEGGGGLHMVFTY